MANAELVASVEPLPVGVTAPDFTLKDQNNQDVTLSDFRGRKNVLLVFFPLPFTGICTGELQQIRDSLPKFRNDRSEILAISVGAASTHKVWSAENGYLFPVLADFWPHGEVTQAYRVFNAKAGYGNRGTFVVDTDGIIRFSQMQGPGQARDQAAWEIALNTLDS